MTENEFPEFFATDAIEVGNENLQARWIRWSPLWRSRLVKLANAAHNLGLDWYHANGPDGRDVLRAARKELGRRAEQNTVMLIVGCSMDHPTAKGYPHPARDRLQLDLTELDRLDDRRAADWLHMRLGNLPPPRIKGEAYWPRDYGQ